MVPLKDVQPLTGYIRGGVTVFGARKPFPVYIDETAILFDKISVSAGARGTQLILAPGDYLRAAQALEVEVADRRPDKRCSEARRFTGHGRPMTRALWTHLVKDLRIEWRSLDAIISMLFFSLPGRGALLHRLRPARSLLAQIAGGVLCVATMFASVSALNQAWAREIRHQVHRRAAHGARARRGTLPRQGHRQLPLRHHCADHPGAVLFDLVQPAHRRARPGCWLLVLPLGTWALVANGIFFAALSIRSRNRELLLSLILFPIFIPALLAMVQATTAILTGESDPTLWIKLLLGYDIIFTTVSLLLFDVVFHAE